MKTVLHLMQQRRNRSARSGFTLVELSIGATLLTAILAGILTICFTYRKTFHVQTQLVERNQNLRAGLEMLSRELRMCGYGVTAADSDLDDWFNWVPGLTKNPWIQQGASTNDPDRVTLVGAFEAAASTLLFASAAGATTLNIALGHGSRFSSSANRVIFIGRLEMACVRSVSGDTLTISVHPTLAGHGLVNAYPNGTPIELVKAVSYSCEVDATESLRYLSRSENVPGTSDPKKRIAVGVENLQITVASNTASVQLTGMTQLADESYADAVQGDGHRRITMRTRLLARNL